MPEAKERKRGGGPKPYRTFYTSISFRVTPQLHEGMKTLTVEYKVRLEDVYREAVLMLLNLRVHKAFIYQGAPRVAHSTRVNIKMHDSLKARVQEVADADHHAVPDFFESAVSLYLGKRGQAWRKRHPPTQL